MSAPPRRASSLAEKLCTVAHRAAASHLDNALRFAEQIPIEEQVYKTSTPFVAEQNYALWPGAELVGSGAGAATERAAAAVVHHCREVIDATAEACVAVKLQLARFELLGAPGWAALQEVAAHARLRGLLVIADGKRGDIDVSAQAYASALFGGCETPFGQLPGLGAEMATVNPLMGLDAIAVDVVVIALRLPKRSGASEENLVTWPTATRPPQPQASVCRQTSSASSRLGSRPKSRWKSMSMSKRRASAKIRAICPWLSRSV